VCKAKRAGDALDQAVRGLASDGAGHVLAVGDFQGNLSFGGAQLSATGTYAFVAVLDATFGPVWNRAFPASVLAGAFDAAGNVVIAGTYGSSVTLDFGCGKLDPNAGFFLAKLDHATGNCVFSKALTAPFVRASLAVAANGDAVLAGTTSGTVDVGMGPLPNLGGTDVFVGRFDGAAGALSWARSYGTSGDDAIAGVAIDPTSGGVFVAGDFNGKLDLSTGGNPLDSQGTRDIFVAGLSATGTALWATQLHGPGDDVATGLARLPSGGLVVGGDYVMSIDVGGMMQQSQMASAFFVARLGADGVPTWATSYDGMGNGAVAAIGAGASGIALTGSAPVDATNAKLWVATLDANGKKGSESTFGGSGLERGTGVVFDGTALAIGGHFDGALDLGSAGMLASAGARDVFLVRLCP
jgi:hypothetical protein